jgi:hypothetical protein
VTHLEFPETVTLRMSRRFIRDFLEEAADYNMTFDLWGMAAWWDTWAEATTDIPGIKSITQVYRLGADIIPIIDYKIYRIERKVNVPHFIVATKFLPGMVSETTDTDWQRLVEDHKTQGYKEWLVYNTREHDMPVRPLFKYCLPCTWRWYSMKKMNQIEITPTSQYAKWKIWEGTG